MNQKIHNKKYKQDSETKHKKTQMQWSKKFTRGKKANPPSAYSISIMRIPSASKLS